MAVKTDLLKRTLYGLLGLIGGWFVIAEPAAAEPEPPWIDPSLSGDALGEGGADTIAVLNWLLQRQDDPAIKRIDFRSFVFSAAYDAAYPFSDANTDSPDLAIAMAERFSFYHLDIKEILLADLKFGPNGTEPSSVAYDHALYKTALYLFANPSRTLFAKGLFYDRPINVVKQQTAMISESTVRNDAVAVLRVDDPGDGSLLKIANEVLARMPVVQRHVFETEPCKLVEEARSFLEGTSPVGQDLETAELLLYLVRWKHTFSRGGADAFFLVGRYIDQFYIHLEVRDRESFFRAAADLGHPEAAYEIAQVELARGDPRAAAQQLLVADGSDRFDLGDVISDLQARHGLGDIQQERERAMIYVSLFRDFGCV